jgi:tRNA pseudouridine38-40 synthase
MRMPADKFPFALNQRLPDDIVVQSGQETAPDWHPRHCDSVKTYEYRILQAAFPDPLTRNTALFYHYPLDVERMKRAASSLEGEHDFASFCSSGTAVKTTVRTVFSCEVLEEPAEGGFETRFPDQPPLRLPKKYIIIRISGSGFLYNMVRIIAGTLIQVGNGEREPEAIPDILHACDRAAAGPTAPACGLTMLGIRYISPADQVCHTRTAPVPSQKQA